MLVFATEVSAVAEFSEVCSYFPVVETSGTDAVDGGGELVTRISAARSAKVMGPNLDWAVVWRSA
jgi:hypothetical protein